VDNLEKMKDVNYIEIIKKSCKITCEKKYLWWFGLFMALGGGFGFNFPGSNNWDKKIEEKEDLIGGFVSQHWQIVILLISFFVLLGIVLFIFKIISQAGLIKTLDEIEKNKQGSFKNGFKEGKKYFWKIVTIGIILTLLVLVLIIILSVPAMFLFYLDSMAFGILVAGLAFAILIPSIILATYIGKFACFYIILSDLEIKSSLENGYQIFRKNILASIIMSLFFIPVNIALFILIMALALIFGIIFLIIGLILRSIIAEVGTLIAIVSGITFFVVSLVFVNSIFQVFCQTVWFLFFKEVAGIEEEKKILESEKEVIRESIPSPEEA